MLESLDKSKTVNELNIEFKKIITDLQATIDKTKNISNESSDFFRWKSNKTIRDTLVWLKTEIRKGENLRRLADLYGEIRSCFFEKQNTGQLLALLSFSILTRTSFSFLGTDYKKMNYDIVDEINDLILEIDGMIKEVQL